MSPCQHTMHWCTHQGLSCRNTCLWLSGAHTWASRELTPHSFTAACSHMLSLLGCTRVNHPSIRKFGCNWVVYAGGVCKHADAQLTSLFIHTDVWLAADTFVCVYPYFMHAHECVCMLYVIQCIVVCAYCGPPVCAVCVHVCTECAHSTSSGVFDTPNLLQCIPKVMVCCAVTRCSPFTVRVPMYV